MKTCNFCSVVLVIQLFITAAQSQCSIDFLRQPANAPLYINALANNRFEVIAPVNGKINVAEGKSISVSCANPSVPKDDQLFKVVCQKQQFKRTISGKESEFNWLRFACTRPHQKAAIKENANKNQLCPRGSELYKIGFKVPSLLDSFVNWVDICFDLNTRSTSLAVHTLYQTRMPNTGSERPSFAVGDLDTFAFNLNPQTMNDCFNPNTQVKRFPKQVTNKEEYYFARGHLAPCSDGITKAFYDATFYYLNVIPQWQKVNNGNWLKVEKVVRNIAKDRGDCTVYTGTHESQTLNNFNTFCTGGVKIPKWIYKVVVTKQKEGIAFVTLNDPYVLEALALPCTDICGSNWLNSASRTDRKKGYTICCRIEDLNKRVGVFQSLSGVKLLTPGPSNKI